MKCNTGQLSTCNNNTLNVVKKEQNDFIDVCSTEDNFEDKENMNPPLTSPRASNRKNCLVATFSRMSPFKGRQPTANESENSAQSSTQKRPFGFSTARTCLMQKFSFASFSPSTSIATVEKCENSKLNSELRNTIVSNDDAESETEDVESGATAASTNGNPAAKASRKEKSLGKLCRRFLLTMGEEAKSSTNDVHLESVARKMNVEKRRIYDIVNVMEALEAMSKTNKSFYKWHGLSALPQLMYTLQKEAIEAKFPERIMQVEQAMCSFTELSSVGSSTAVSSSGIRRTLSSSSDIVGSLVEDCSFNKSLSNSSLNDTLHKNSFNDDEKNLAVQSADSSFNNSSTSILSNDSARLCHEVNSGASGKNSLAQLCRRFLMVLLCNPKDKRRVSLDVASTVLIKDPESEGFEPPSRSRCRRLYDIANVLVAMELIKKVHYLFGTKKIPLFVYCGPEPDASPVSAELNMREFLNRIGLSAINVGPSAAAITNNNGEINNVLSAPVSSQEQHKFRIPKLQQQQQQPNDNKLNQMEYCMPPSSVASKSTYLNKIKTENCSTNLLEEQQRSLFKTASSELSSGSRSLSSSTSSLSSTLSQPTTSSSSSVQYLVDMAELVRKRLHSTTSTSIFDRKLLERQDNDLNKENKSKSVKHKRQKISGFGAPFNESNNNNNNNKLGVKRGEPELVDLPKPKPVIPLSSLNFSITQPNGSLTPTAIAWDELFRGIPPQAATATAPTDLPSQTNYLTMHNNVTTPPMSFCFGGDASMPYFMLPSALANATNAISQQLLQKQQKNYEKNQQSPKLSNKPKVRHSVLSILGVSEAENVSADFTSSAPFFSSSPKAFKPVNHNN